MILNNNAMSDILNLMLTNISDSLDNPYSLLMLIIIFLLILSLILAIFSKSVKHTLIHYKILEKDESPASFLCLIICILIIIKIIQAYVIQPFLVDGGSMLPNLYSGELLIIDKISSSKDNLQRGDVIVFRHVKEDQFNGKFFIKRLIALPGDRIIVQDGVTTIYNNENPNGEILNEDFVKYTDYFKNAEMSLGEDEYFAMGDNRAESYDSRNWGVIYKKDIAGKPVLRLLPINKISTDPGFVPVTFIKK